MSAISILMVKVMFVQGRDVFKCLLGRKMVIVYETMIGEVVTLNSKGHKNGVLSFIYINNATNTGRNYQGAQVKKSSLGITLVEKISNLFSKLATLIGNQEVPLNLC